MILVPCGIFGKRSSPVSITAKLSKPETASKVSLPCNMPNMDGLTMVKKVRENDKTTPIIMVTTEAEKPRIIDAIKAGVNNYVVKPFTPDALKSKIDETMKKVAQPS